MAEFEDKTETGFSHDFAWQIFAPLNVTPFVTCISAVHSEKAN